LAGNQYISKNNSNTFSDFLIASLFDIML